MENKRTVDEILLELVDAMDVDMSIGMDKKFETEVFSTLKGSKGFTEYLLETMNQDLKRFFSASSEEQSGIRGAFSRTAYLRGKLINAENK